MNPNKLNKYLYIEKTPTWYIRSVYIFGILAWLLVVIGFIPSIVYDPFYRWIVGPVMVIFTIYTISTFGLNIFYRKFDLKAHFGLLKKFWIENTREPSVDIFLPICGEDIEMLRNTWKNVAKLRYKNKKVYVLDDSKEDYREHEKMAKHYGFNYFERPNKGEMKKAGNLKYGYERTKGDFIVIFDADFAPHPDFLKELLPYMDDQKIGIVQSPQYFETTDAINQRSALEYGSANIQECFYRYIELTRDRFDATVCCGTNAIYRRAALDEIGGTVQAGHSEDQRTGFALQSRGWVVRYVPVILAVGLCPENLYTYFHQQHRWCAGNIELMMSRKFWSSPVSWKTKLCYATGFLFYLHHPISILFSFQLFYSLFFYNQSISIANGILFYPYLIFSIAYIGFFPISKFRWGALYALVMRTYGYSHAILATLLNSSVGWIPTNAKHINVSMAFRHTTLAVGVYIALYSTFLGLAIRNNFLHPLNYNYYSVQFWIFYNLFLSGLLLWQMYKTMAQAQSQQVANGTLSRAKLQAWHLKTAGLYILLLFLVIYCTIYI